MNKVITVNLNGNAYQLEENGYEALRAYLQSAAATLASNPDKDEIIADIEQAIADKFRVLLSAYKTVVTAREVEAAISEMGAVNDGTESEGTASTPPGAGSTAGAASDQPPSADESASTSTGQTRRLYRLHEGAMIAGVCNGISAYIGIDVTLVRIIFVLLAIASAGFWSLAYVVMMLIIPVADSAAEKAAAHGATATAQEFIRRARRGYYESTKGFSDRAARRAWKRKFKREMREWRRNFKWEVRSNMAQCQQNWHQYWSKHPAPGFEGWASASLLGLIEAILGILCAACILSLILTGAIFGLALPAGVHLWIGILLLVVFCHVLAWPIRAARHFILYRSPYSCGGGGLFSLFIIFLVFWFVFPHQTREFIDAIPSTVHHLVEQLREWWGKH